MPSYTAITIIYNPISTGSSKELAKYMQQALKKALPKQHITLVATEHAGHAEELAYTHAKKTAQPLIISSSGDGGYNEVVNGVLRAKAEGAKPTVGLLPAGNANDHYHSVRESSQDILSSVLEHQVRQIDVLRLSGTRGGKPFERYAHSYIGLGLSPAVGKELNKTQLNRLKEAWIVLKTLGTFHHTQISIQGRVQSFDSLVFTNVGRMAKFLNFAQTSEVDDGKFEVSGIRHRNSFRLLLSLLRASTVGTHNVAQTNEFTFRTIARTNVQLDGEVLILDAKTDATVSIMHKALRCIT